MGKKIIERMNVSKLLTADRKGKIFELPRLEAVGMKAGKFFVLKMPDLIRLPLVSEIFHLPGRAAIAYDPVDRSFVEDKDHLAVAAFLPPGYTVTYNSAYSEIGRPKPLPLFAYAACAIHDGNIYAAAIRVDRSLCHDPRFMDMKPVKHGAAKLKKIFPKNRLVKHLERCALCYGCPNAKNLFLNRYEAPLPVSPACNAQCAGCISYQPKKRCPVTQPRIKFIPTPGEIAQIALYHIYNVKRPIVSFGQGCEGEPLISADVIEKAIRSIRKCSSKGVINMNTNASRPNAIAKLFDSGLDSIRVSLNSAREEYYTEYYKPKDYSFSDVARSIKEAKKRSGFVSLNYLTMPGFTDSKDEVGALKKFVEKNLVDMIQWRNLNYDPLRYFEGLKISVKREEMFGVKETIDMLKKDFPAVKIGYFNSYEGVNSRRI
ncbi:MAG: radical SAM protein [Candidatus Omnitrophota bacterium]|nr:radical SAM protein [Candidatus Omnitrophota bacterium]